MGRRWPQGQRGQVPQGQHAARRCHPFRPLVVRGAEDGAHPSSPWILPRLLCNAAAPRVRKDKPKAKSKAPNLVPGSLAHARLHGARGVSKVSPSPAVVGSTTTSAGRPRLPVPRVAARGPALGSSAAISALSLASRPPRSALVSRRPSRRRRVSSRGRSKRRQWRRSASTWPAPHMAAIAPLTVPFVRPAFPRREFGQEERKKALRVSYSWLRLSLTKQSLYFRLLDHWGVRCGPRTSHLSIDMNRRGAQAFETVSPKVA